ncbi:hypothetical protein VTN00DRAFT_5793 [Thermoascus crustaceus]|uniref:uncharacterized protein n=1 Tax=Thermoascus crustaceus TaxID=5088 RepID=UPI003743EF26
MQTDHVPKGGPRPPTSPYISWTTTLHCRSKALIVESLASSRLCIRHRPVAVSTPARAQRPCRHRPRGNLEGSTLAILPSSPVHRVRRAPASNPPPYSLSPFSIAPFCVLPGEAMTPSDAGTPNLSPLSSLP